MRCRSRGVPLTGPRAQHMSIDALEPNFACRGEICNSTRFTSLPVEKCIPDEGSGRNDLLMLAPSRACINDHDSLVGRDEDRARLTARPRKFVIRSASGSNSNRDYAGTGGSAAYSSPSGSRSGRANCGNSGGAEHVRCAVSGSAGSGRCASHAVLRSGSAICGWSCSAPVAPSRTRMQPAWLLMRAAEATAKRHGPPTVRPESPPRSRQQSSMQV